MEAQAKRSPKGEAQAWENVAEMTKPHRGEIHGAKSTKQSQQGMATRPHRMYAAASSTALLSVIEGGLIPPFQGSISSRP